MLAAVTFVGSLAFAVAADPPVTGDEPHYLVYATSLGRGWGFDLERAYRPIERSSFAPDPKVDEHAFRYRPDGPLATWHQPGMAFLLAPVGRLADPTSAARVVLSALTSLLVYHLYAVCKSVTRARTVALALAVIAVIWTAPVFWYGTLIFPEIPAALCLVLSLRAFLAERRSVVTDAAAGGFAFLASIFTTRAAIVSVGLICAYVWNRLRTEGRSTGRRNAVPLLVPVVVVGLGRAALDWYLYGSPLPTSSLGEVPAGAPLVAGLNQPINLWYFGIGGTVAYPSGILPYSPVLALLFCMTPRAGWLIGWRRLLVVAAPVAAYTVVVWFVSSPGAGPPGRYLVPVLPLLAVPAAAVLDRAGRVLTGVAVALTAFSVAIAWWPVESFARLYGPAFGLEKAAVRPVTSLWPHVVYPIAENATYIAESLPSDVGEVRRVQGVDVRASSPALARGHLVYGPYATFEPGTYEVRFTLWGGPDRPVPGEAALDVYASKERVSLAERRVHPQPGGFETIAIPVRLEAMTDLEFRVFDEGHSTIGVARVDVFKRNPQTPQQRRSGGIAAVGVAFALCVVAAWWAVRSRPNAAVEDS